jgi:hypothetical protein
MSKPIDKKLYQQAVNEAKIKFDTWPSAYASMWVQKRYQEKGGKYATTKKQSGGTTQWRAEKWINMNDWLKGKITPCGMPEGMDKACRPIKRINATTPITAAEVIAKHGLEKTKKLANAKQKDQSGTRVNWNTGKVTKRK